MRASVSVKFNGVRILYFVLAVIPCDIVVIQLLFVLFGFFLYYGNLYFFCVVLISMCPNHKNYLSFFFQVKISCLAIKYQLFELKFDLKLNHYGVSCLSLTCQSFELKFDLELNRCGVQHFWQTGDIEKKMESNTETSTTGRGLFSNILMKLPEKNDMLLTTIMYRTQNDVLTRVAQKFTIR